MDFWFAEQQARLRLLPETKRYLYDVINWKQHCFGLLGARGAGKTTLMLQYIRDNYFNSDKALYVSVDHPKFQSISLYDFAEEFYQYGGELIIFDEVHKYPDWASHIKALYDSCPRLKIVFSGSSLLQLRNQNADLSRRAIIYYLHGLSFREFLYLRTGVLFPKASLQDIIDRHMELAGTVMGKVRPLKYFQEYLQYGYYPFFLEGEDIYPVKVNEIVNQILEMDLPYVNRVDLRQISKLKKLLYILSVTLPSDVNILKLSSATEISRPKIYEYIEYLKEACLLNTVREEGKGYKILTKPDKIYLDNTNLIYAIAKSVKQKTVREAFFVNQIKNSYTNYLSTLNNPVELTENGEFVVDGKYIFEVGEKNIETDQINSESNMFMVADGIECGLGKKIPLWLFGFIY